MTPTFHEKLYRPWITYSSTFGVWRLVCSFGGEQRTNEVYCCPGKPSGGSSDVSTCRLQPYALNIRIWVWICFTWLYKISFGWKQRNILCFVCVIWGTMRVYLSLPLFHKIRRCIMSKRPEKEVNWGKLAWYLRVHTQNIVYSAAFNQNWSYIAMWSISSFIFVCSEHKVATCKLIYPMTHLRGLQVTNKLSYSHKAT